MLLAARSSGLGLLEAAWGCEEWLHVVVQWFPSSFLVRPLLFFPLNPLPWHVGRIRVGMCRCLLLSLPPAHSIGASAFS